MTFSTWTGLVKNFAKVLQKHTLSILQILMPIKNIIENQNFPGNKNKKVVIGQMSGNGFQDVLGILSKNQQF